MTKLFSELEKDIDKGYDIDFLLELAKEIYQNFDDNGGIGVEFTIAFRDFLLGYKTEIE